MVLLAAIIFRVSKAFSSLSLNLPGLPLSILIAAAVNSLQQRLVGAEHNCAIVVVWQAFGVITDLIWIKIFIRVRGVLQILRRVEQPGLGCITTELSAVVCTLV